MKRQTNLVRLWTIGEFVFKPSWTTDVLLKLNYITIFLVAFSPSHFTAHTFGCNVFAYVGACAQVNGSSLHTIRICRFKMNHLSLCFILSLAFARSLAKSIIWYSYLLKIPLLLLQHNKTLILNIQKLFYTINGSILCTYNPKYSFPAAAAAACVARVAWRAGTLARN